MDFGIRIKLPYDDNFLASYNALLKLLMMVNSQSSLYVHCMLMMRLEMEDWRVRGLPMWDVMRANLQSTLNEECGEISLAMLAQVQHRNQMMNVQHTTRAWKQCILRYNIAREWGLEFGHRAGRKPHRMLDPESAAVEGVVAFFLGKFESILERKWSHYVLGKVPSMGYTQAECESRLCRVPIREDPRTERREEKDVKKARRRVRKKGGKKATKEARW